jgi:DnaA N-terminal domain
MSREAIAAALAREDLSCGERLVAFSLASFADRENRARPGTPAAAGRAGLARSRFLEARDRLVGRGLVVVEDVASGRGRASTVVLPFAETGPWWEGEINAELFEAVLGYSRTRGSARLLLAVMAALADEQSVVEGVTTERLCAAAGVADRTYRRARATLLASGEVLLRSGSGGRGNMNCWEIPDPRAHTGTTPPARGRRVPPPAGARPLMATVAVPAAPEEQATETVPAGVVLDAAGHAVRAVNGGQDRTVSVSKGPALTGVSEAKGGQDRTLPGQNRPALTGISAGKGGQGRTVSPETPAKTPAKTPAPNARAGREPQNPRTLHPPNPPGGGSDAGQVLVEETYLTDRGRRRRRLVAVDLAAVGERLRAAGEADLAAWEQVRAFLREAVGESTFEIWLAALELIVVDVEGTLIVSAPPETVGWVARRFGRVLDGAARRSGHRLRVADELERKAGESLRPIAAAAASAAPVGLSADARFGPHVSSDGCAVDVQSVLSRAVPSDRSRASRDAQSTGRPTYTSAYPSSYADVYTQTKEVS